MKVSICVEILRPGRQGRQNWIINIKQCFRRRFLPGDAGRRGRRRKFLDSLGLAFKAPPLPTIAITLQP